MQIYTLLCSICLEVCDCSPCVVYYLEDSQHCATAHPTCSYVQPYKNQTLETVEPLLDTLFNHVQTGMKNGSITHNCSEAFSLFYCHQVYTQCSEMSPQALCKSDCLDVMSECEFEWDFLRELVDSINAVDLPSLPSNCATDGNSTEEDCRPLMAGMDTHSYAILMFDSRISNPSREILNQLHI